MLEDDVYSAISQDGTSQQSRIKAPLSPHSVAIDGRTTKELLEFVRKFCSQVNYFDETASINGNWQALFPASIDLDELLAYIENPSALSTANKALYQRPHFVLLVSFIKLIEQVNTKLNGISRRHLDFYYLSFLQLSKQSAQADKVNVIIELAKQYPLHCLKAGTLLNAGKNAQGQSLTYKIDQDVAISHAKIGQLSSIYTDIDYVDIGKARDDFITTNPSASPADVLLMMLKFTLGYPEPTNELPSYNVANEDEQLTTSKLVTLKLQLAFVNQQAGFGLYMTFTDFSELMSLKNQRLPHQQVIVDQQLLNQYAQDWSQINNVLTAIADGHNNVLLITENNKTNFDDHLLSAMGGPLNFSGLIGVNNLTDLYHEILRADVIAYVENVLKIEVQNPDNALTFVRMMQVKVRIDLQWQRINSLLEQAALAKNKIINIAPTNSDRFKDNLNLLLLDGPEIAWPLGILNIDQLYYSINYLENYFYIPAFEFKHVLNLIESVDKVINKHNYLSIDKILLKGALKKRRIKRRLILEALPIPTDDSNSLSVAQSLANLLAKVLSKPIRVNQLGLTLFEIKPHLDHQDYEYIKQFSIDELAIELDWHRVIDILLALWHRLVGKDLPLLANWQNLYAFADATKAKISFDAQQQQTQRWATFARKTTHEDDIDPQSTAFGWAMSSPILLLSEGLRKITLELIVEAQAVDIESLSSVLALQPFKALLSTHEGWIEAQELQVKPTFDEENNLLALHFEMELATDAAPIVAPNDANDPESSWPMLKLLLRHVIDDAFLEHSDQHNRKSLTVEPQYKTYYQYFKGIRLNKVNISVSVKGLNQLTIENDEKILDINKPFYPFTLSPVEGSRFYLSHPEFVYKKLDNLVFNTQWMGLPKDIASYYKGYPALEKEDDIFNMEIVLKDGHKKISIIKPVTKKLLTSQCSLDDISDGASAEYDRDLRKEPTESVKKWGRYLYWQLKSPDFQHTNYPALATAKAAELAIALVRVGGDTNKKFILINPPYTPKLKSLNIEYTASISIDANSFSKPKSAERLFYIEPFGYAEFSLANNVDSYFLPQFDNQGELYIGLDDLKLPQNLSLLFQVAQGSSDADLTPKNVQWSYLSGNQWVVLAGDSIINDGTQGLINTGIIEFSLTSAAPNTLLSQNLYWLRASIKSNTQSVCDMVSIHAQAVQASFVIGQQSIENKHVLAANSIKKLQKSIAQIKRVQQPYSSFGGRENEPDEGFYRRISERLRHKNRALTQWDYEHLILQQYPEIYKAKCIPASMLGTDEAAGTVKIILIPDIRQRLPFDPFEPKVSANLLYSVSQFLADKKALSAKILVSNAQYIPVKVQMDLKFHAGFNPQYYQTVLNNELNKFLSPWAYEKSIDIVIGGKIYANSIINFVEQRDYIDYVAGIKLYKGVDQQYVLPSIDKGYFVATDQIDGVLVAARQHQFNLVKDKTASVESLKGINYMKIELDFQIA
jgi:hypothetical protein